MSYSYILSKICYSYTHTQTIQDSSICYAKHAVYTREVACASIGSNTHLSVFFVLMRGEYDPLLKWPFEYKVSLVLVDQDMKQHIVQTFVASPESSSFQRPRSDMNVASGCPQFAKLSVIDEGNYVRDDVMFLKCIVDTSKIIHP